MALTEEEKCYIHESSRLVAKEIISEVLIAHINACPHGQAVAKAKWVVIGLGIGASAAGGGGLVAGLMSIMK